MYWKVALSGNEMQSLSEVSAKIDSYNWSGGWRANDNADKDIWNASNPDDEEELLWKSLPNVFILETATMKIVKAQDFDGNIDIPKEVAALNAK